MQVDKLIYKNNETGHQQFIKHFACARRPSLWKSETANMDQLSPFVLEVITALTFLSHGVIENSGWVGVGRIVLDVGAV